MQSLDERLAELRRALDTANEGANHHRSQMEAHERSADLIRERINGIEEARVALQPKAGTSAAPPRRRRERRDIKALVRKAYAEGPYTEAEDIARVLNCRISQVRKAVEALRKGATK